MEQWVSGTTKSAAGQNYDLEAKRKTLVRNALRFDRGGSKKEQNPFEDTDFKPFSIRELEYDIWDNQMIDSNKSNNVINRLNNQVQQVDPRHDMSFLTENYNPNRSGKNVSFN